MFYVPLAGVRSRSPNFFLNPEVVLLQNYFWIFMYSLQCQIIFVQLEWTYTSNLNFVRVILCTVLEHAMIKIMFK